MCELRKIDWSQCPFVGVDPKKLGGAPTLRDTRMPVSAIVDKFDHGLSVDEIMEQFEVSREDIEAVLEYAKTHVIRGGG